MPHRVVLIVLCALPLAAQAQDENRIAIMSAFPPEIGVLREAMTNAASTRINGTEFITGQLEGRDVVVFLSGVSMVHAAMITQLALDHFEVGTVVFSGSAGGVDPDLNIGDVVVAAKWGKYMEGVMAREAEDGFAIPPWMTSEFANFGMIFTRPYGVAHSGAEEPDTRFWFDVDPGLLATAKAVAETITLEDCTGEGACLTEPPQILVGGTGVSGSFFMDNAALRQHVFDTFEAQVVDMESAAVATVAFSNDVPFIAFRSLSDLAGGGDGANEMNTFLALAATNAATTVRAFVAALN